MANDLPIVLFTLGEQQYALPCRDVRRIVQAVDIAPVPNVSKNILGVINVEGEIITVMNIRYQLGLSESEIALTDFIVICNFGNESFGFLVNEIDFIAV